MGQRGPPRLLRKRARALGALILFLTKRGRKRNLVFFVVKPFQKGGYMQAIQMDWLVIFIAAIVNMAIGFVWYSKWLFGPTWAKLSDVKEKRIRPQTMFFTLIISLVIAYFLSFFEGHLGITDVSDGMCVGFFLWLGFVATSEMSAVIWGKKKFKLFVVDGGYKLVSFLAMSGIIGS
jgi:hypothetical protein